MEDGTTRPLNPAAANAEADAKGSDVRTEFTSSAPTWS